MKKMTLLILLSCSFFITQSAALGDEEFLKAPLISGGEIIKKTETRLEMKAALSHDDIVNFYRDALKNHEDIKFRDWKDATYIEDDGKRPWHSITISKEDKEGTNIIIAKDNWTWIIGTLVLRFIGVFVVLLFLMLGMYASGSIISRSIKKMEQKKA